ncbi:MAG: ATP-dependent Clp protease adaptor ClpS [Bacteroidales bacterium]|nr:ATP-dependent Clp protease adaptor ClpS [Bacteroidales bacterium]
MVKEKQETFNQYSESTGTEKELVLYNDDHNTFEYVIDSLIEVCAHAPEQAEQCAFVAHTKGKCGIKNGDYSFLESMHSELLNRGLTTKIE